MKIKKLRISALFYDNRFLLVFSVIAAILIWLVVAVEFSETTNIIRNVPVKIDYSRIEENMGLEPFGESDFTVDVTVSGKRHIVEDDDLIDNLVVTANTGYVNSVGTATLNIDVSSSSLRPEYTIDAISLASVDVYFDYLKEAEFIIEAEIEHEGGLVPEGYYVDDLIFPNNNTVKVSGPETEVNKISRIVARAEIKNQLRQSATIDAALVALTKDGNSPKFISFNRQRDVVNLTIPVYKKVVLPAVCAFSNKPSDYVEEIPFTVSVSPSSAEFAVAESKAENLESFEIAAIDFSKLSIGENTFTVPAEDINGGKVIDSTESFTVTVTVGGMSSKAVGVPSQVNFINVPDGITAELIELSTEQLTVIGPSASLEALTAENIVLEVDLSVLPDNTLGTVVVPVTMVDNDCWAYGEYTAKIMIK
ncbi:MAG: hypothetical protein IJB45_01780 [Clostridia bacterium]|nr:hypothetical protein [Clostridia bacterium]